MMKQLTVRRISGDIHFATQVAAVFQEHGIETHQVDVLPHRYSSRSLMIIVISFCIGWSMNRTLAP